eukprot:COSAG06_NODE_59684_length_273_cov_0.879310_2_plen_24_part_01
MVESLHLRTSFATSKIYAWVASFS